MAKTEFEGEALVLDSRAYRDRDLLLSLLSPDTGVVRGVFRRARGGRAPKAAAAQILSLVIFTAYQGPHAELANFRALELVRSSFPLAHTLETASAAAAVAETLLRFCPPGEPSPRRFRLGKAVLFALLAGVPPDGALAYTQLWILRLGGLLSSLDSCEECESMLVDTAVGSKTGSPLRCIDCAPAGLHLGHRDLQLLRLFVTCPPENIAEPPSSSLILWLDGAVRQVAEGRMPALDFHRSQEPARSKRDSFHTNS